MQFFIDIALSIFWLSGIFISYTLLLFPFILFLLNKMSNRVIEKRETLFPKEMPSITVIVAAFNEEKVVHRRITNLLEQEYPQDKVEIIIASDGSTDNTAHIARQCGGNRVKVLEYRLNRGRAAVHNDSVANAMGDIVIFTDANALFEKDYLKKTVESFLRETVGCVVGNLMYKTVATQISESEGHYWKYEKNLRKLESDLGILATGSGACIAIRKKLWKELTSIDDVDFATPLDIIMQGFSIVFNEEAVAYDSPASSTRGELNTRIRQTSKNIVGSWNHWGWRGIMRHPAISWGLFSHKFLRWFTPLFMVTAFVSNSILFNVGNIYRFAFAFQVLFYALALIGLLGEFLKKKISLASSIYSFCVANMGIGIGVLKGFCGKAPAAYKIEE